MISITRYLLFCCFCCLLPPALGEQQDEVFQDSKEQTSSNLEEEQTFDPIHNQSQVLVLVPNNVNVSDTLSHRSAFNLFKLDTNTLFNTTLISLDAPESDEMSSEVRADEDENTHQVALRRITRDTKADLRDGRKMNLFRGMWQKPRTSPLYLVNGTVCRFINFVPICTTLTTTGLMPAAGSTGARAATPAGGGASGGSAPAGGATGNRPAAQPSQSGGSSVQFANPQRPATAALVGDEGADINVDPLQNNIVQQDQVSSGLNQVPSAQTVARPVGYVVNRRPLSLLPFRRPLGR